MPLVVALLVYAPAPSRIWAAEDVASPNLPPRLVVAVLPFENATGEAAQEDWRQALPSLVRLCVRQAKFVSSTSSKIIEPSLRRAGWTATKVADTALARQVGRELQANVVVWGSFRRETNGWAVSAQVLRAGSETVPVEVRATAPHWVELAESLGRRVAKQLGRSIADDDREIWKQEMPDSDQAAACLARAIALEIGDAPSAKKEDAWRAVLAADPRCVIAHGGLIELLGEPERRQDFEQAVQELIRQPRSCYAHLGRAMLFLTQDDESKAEAEMLEALRQHRGCRDAVRSLFRLLAPASRWADLTRILREALARRPDAESTRIFLALALVKAGDRKEGRAVLEPIEDLPEEDMVEDLALCQVACAVGRVDLAGLELLRLNSQAETNSIIRKWLEAPVTVSSEEVGSNATMARPRSFTPAELSAELERRLTAEERQLGVNPVEITPEVRAEARRLKNCLTNEYLRAFALFAEVARRGRGSGDGGQRTASESLKDSADPETRLSCQEHAKLFVALARALGLEAWITHIEQCADGSPGYHDCAALLLGGDGVLVDTTWGVFDIEHKEFTVLDDVQAISHQAMQGRTKPDPRRLRMGLKLNPEDRWTRLQFVRGMARAGELDAAAEELRKVQSTGAETWDVHEAAAELEIAREHWKSALDALQRALTLSPSNATVHFKLASVYGELKDPAKSKEHLEMALSLNRGEFSPEIRRQSQRQIAFLTAFSETQSGGRRARESLQSRAEAGDAAAQLALAKACFEAQPPRIEEAMRWLLLAAEAGEVSAQFEYARNLLLLRGEEAAKEAVAWLAKSANQGYAVAQYQLGLILYEGKLAQRDNVASGQWVYLAADQGHVEARRLLKEMQLFLTADELKQARQRADTFKPLKKKSAISTP